MTPERKARQYAQTKAWNKKNKKRVAEYAAQYRKDHRNEIWIAQQKFAAQRKADRAAKKRTRMAAVYHPTKQQLIDRNWRQGISTSKNYLLKATIK